MTEYIFNNEIVDNDNLPEDIKPYSDGRPIYKVIGELIRCKDCRYFELNHFDNINGIPVITAHEICTKWGDGCKTSQDGYCFTAERKEK